MEAPELFELRQCNNECDEKSDKVFESTQCEMSSPIVIVGGSEERSEADKNKTPKKPIKAYLNILAFLINTALKREVIKNYPVSAIIEPTTFCNLQCPGCPTGLRLGLRKPTALQWELYKKIIDEIGDYVFRLRMHNWGEPLLHSQTPEFIKYAKAKGIQVLLSTNLNPNLTDEYIERLVKSGLDELIVSLDGVTENIYKKYRRGGNLSVVRKNMLRIRAAKKRYGTKSPIITWQFLVFRHNEHEIETAMAHYKEWGADKLMLFGAYVPYKSYGAYFAPSTIPQYNIYHPSHYYITESKKQLTSNRTCSWLYGVFLLNPDGKVSPCCLPNSEKDDFGNYVQSKSFFNVWNNSTFRMARRLLPQCNNLKDKALIEARAREMTKIPDRTIFFSSRNNDLVCQRCPAPWMQNMAYGDASEIFGKYKQILAKTKSIRYLVVWFLMDLPNSRIFLILRHTFSKMFRIIKYIHNYVRDVVSQK